MRKLIAIAWKELYTTFTNRNLLLIMLVTPLVLSTIIGLAFGGGGDDGPTVENIPVVVVNLDAGLALDEQLAGIASTAPATGTDEPGPDFSFGAQLVTILQGASDAGDDAIAADTETSTLTLPPCTLAETQDEDPQFSTTLEELMTVSVVDSADVARRGVDGGDYAAAIIIPAAFTQGLLPTFGDGNGSDGGLNPFAPAPHADVQIEVYGSNAQPISAVVVRSVVEGIVNSFARSSVALGSMADSVLAEVDLAGIGQVTLVEEDVPAADAPWSEWQRFLAPLRTVSPWFDAILNADGDTIANLSCLFDPALNVITVKQQPLNELQERSRFSRVLVQIGAAQAVFFALFTGVFGIAGIYQERTQWTLQRMLVSPTPRWALLGGMLGGNLVVVFGQIVLLLLALTVVASVVAGALTFIWGSNFIMLFLLVLALSIAVSGLGVLVVGIARTPEQVQIFAPMINMTLGALGGAFGFALPAVVAQFSLIYWGVQAFERLAAGETDIWLHLAVLLGQGVIFFVIGVWLFRKRVAL